MTQLDVLARVLDILAARRIPHMVTGALAVNFYGRPRLTHDIDIVVEVHEEDVAGIVKDLSPDFYVAREAVEEAVKGSTTFNAIHHQSGLKVDFWQLTDDPYDRQRFARRKAEQVYGRQMYLPTAEDVIIVKLDWYKQSGSQRHLDDAIGVWQVQVGSLDREYLRDWCDNRSTLQLLQEVEMKAGEAE